MKRLLILDVNALFHRAHSAMTRACGPMVNSLGMHVTGTYGVLNSLFSTLEKTDYDSIVPCTEGGSNWRKVESTGYKGGREGKDDAFYSDLSILLEDAFPAIGMTVCKQQTYEADDVIAHVARHSPAYDEVHILTCDKDLLACVTNKVKVILFSSTKKTELVDIDGVLKHFGVYPAEVPFYKAIAGDSSDNIAGIPKLGPKTAAKIIQESRQSEVNPEFSAADKIALHPKIAPHASTFIANLRIVDLTKDVKDLRWFASSSPDPLHVEALFESLEFKSFLKRKGKILQTLGCPQ